MCKPFLFSLSYNNMARFTFAVSMDAYPDDLNFMDCNGVEADDLGDLFSANFYPQNTAAFIFDEHSPSSGVMGNDDLAQLPAPPSTTSAAHSNEFLDSNHHHHHDQQEDSHLNGIGFIESDVAKISQSQQHPDWSMTTKNDWQHGGMEANDYLLSNIPVDTPVTATDCAFAEETSTQSSNKNTVPDSQCGLFIFKNMCCFCMEFFVEVVKFLHSGNFVLVF